MPIYSLDKELIFPHPSLANEDGILAVGGDLSPERLLLAYSNGIFPWFSEEDPIIWWSPDPRFVLFPNDIKISRSMKKFLKKNLYHVTFDKDFLGVISNCKNLREEDGTWITDEMLNAYYSLHQLGLAHSVEVWEGNELVGGLYGISLGKSFFGESMFSKKSNASKTALITLAEFAIENNFDIIDCQVHTSYLESMGAIEIDREEFLDIIYKSQEEDTLQGSWESFI